MLDSARLGTWTRRTTSALRMTTMSKKGTSTKKTKNGGGIAIAGVVVLHESRTKGGVELRRIQVHSRAENEIKQISLFSGERVAKLESCEAKKSRK